MLRWFNKNISTVLLALVLAISVWAAAVNAADPNEELTYPEPIPIEIVGQNTGLVITNTYTKKIELTLRAPRSIWAQLTSNQDSIHAILDLSDLEAGEYSLEPQIQVNIQPTRIISYSPTSISIVLDELISRKFPIQLTITGEPSVGYQAGAPRLATDEVTVSGPKSLVERVTAVQASFSLSEARDNINESLSLEAVDESNQVVRGINLSSEKIQIHIPVSQQGGYRDMAVKVVVTGQVANLYRLINISVFPPVVTVYSPDPQLINDLPGVVETEALNINDISEDTSSRLKLILPEGISIIGDQSVLAQISVEPTLGSLTIFDNPLEITNLDPALAAQLSSSTVDVIVSGPLSILGTLSNKDLRVIIDAEGLTIGSHQLSPKAEILIDKIEVESILPESIEIILSNAPLATPTTQP